MKRQSLTDHERLEAMTDQEAERNALDDQDAQPTDEAFWADAEVVTPRTKTPVHIRLNPDVVDFFKSQGPGYQSRINAVLERYVEHQREKAAS